MAVIILFVSLFSFQAFAEDVPEDFEVSLYSAPVMKGALPGPMGVVIGADDNAVLTKTSDDGEESSKTLTLDEGASEALWRVIEEQGFFDLNPAYVDSNVLDGDYAIITVTANGVTHEVKTTNIRLQPFDTIALWINSYFDPENMVLYNAFLEQGLAEDGS
ncbi:MAG: hypothetical protein ACTSU8_04720 [Alphaproteobacteria bacterium]